MDGGRAETQTGWRGSADLWLNAAYEALVDSGLDAVKVMPLAETLGLSRTSFYHHFNSRDALLSALLTRWRDKNTGNLVERCDAYAASITEAMFNLFDCWIDADLFDAAFDLAVRNWALVDAKTSEAVRAADAERIGAIIAMFRRFGYSETAASVRARTVYYTQIGYYSMKLDETAEDRLADMTDYVETFTGRRPLPSETERFLSRHRSV